MAATIEGIHHIPAEEAAKLLGISSDRVLDLVVDGVLEARFGLYGDLLVFIYGEDQPHPTRIPEGEKGRTGEAETTAGFHHGDTENGRGGQASQT